MLNRQLHSFTIALLALLLAGPPLLAQTGVVRGKVTDSTGAPIADADVAIVELHMLTRSDAQGLFSFSKVPRGEHEVSVRRIGFQATTVKAVVGDLEYSYEVVLPVQPTTIAGVNVNSSEVKLRLGIEDFYRRRARGMGGTFFTRQEIIARNPRRTTDVLRNSPGLTIVGMRGGGTGVRFTGKRQCTPALFLDGQEVRDMELDHIPVNDIEGMELYSGPSTTPMQFSHGWSHTDCGAIVIWTRIPGTP